MHARAGLGTRGGEPAVTLAAGDLEATFLPACGMLGASLRHRGDELLAFPHSVAGWRAGATTAIPLLHPWANRLGGWSYRAGGRRVALRGLPLAEDGNGLPIHGTVRGSAFDVVRVATGTRAATLVAALDSRSDPLLSRAFPFPHRLEVSARLGGGQLRVTCVLAPTADVAVPVSFGWHPYLRLPGARRATWRLRLPARTELPLRDDQLPTGDSRPLPLDDAPIGNRTFDDHFVLGRDRRFVVEGGGRRLTVTFDAGYPFGQVYAPPRAQFVCIEPMTATVDALRRGSAPLVAPGNRYTATYVVTVDG